jgi:hypothetical protein
MLADDRAGADRSSSPELQALALRSTARRLTGGHLNSMISNQQIK